jgi:hypothetical protein
LLSSEFMGHGGKRLLTVTEKQWWKDQQKDTYVLSKASLAFNAPILAHWHPAKRLHMVHHADISQALLRCLRWSTMSSTPHAPDAGDAPPKPAFGRREVASNATDYSCTRPGDAFVGRLTAVSPDKTA